MNLHSIASHPEHLTNFLKGWWSRFRQEPYALRYTVSTDVMEYMYRDDGGWNHLRHDARALYERDARHVPTLPPEAWDIIEIRP